MSSIIIVCKALLFLADTECDKITAHNETSDISEFVIPRYQKLINVKKDVAYLIWAAGSLNNRTESFAWLSIVYCKSIPTLQLYAHIYDML